MIFSLTVSCLVDMQKRTYRSIGSSRFSVVCIEVQAAATLSWGYPGRDFLFLEKEL